MSRIGLKQIVICLLAGLLCWGCSEDTPPPKQVPPAKKTHAPRPAPVATSTPESVPPEPPKYVYSPMGRRDPFMNPLKNLEAPIQNEASLTPLQKVDLGQLRVVGIILGRGEPAAMVIGPSGKSFILRKGVKVGKNNGVVIGITADSIKIREKYIDFSGEVRTSVQELQLPKRGGVN